MSSLRKLLRGGTVIDGTGAPRRSGDVLIEGDRIMAIDQIATSDAEIVDVSGLIVCPGFIDVHNHSDGWLLKQPHQVAKTSQGITSEVLMSDGISYAPVNDETVREWMYYMKTLDGLEQADYCGWQSIADYLSLLDGRMAQNVIAQVPYANVRSMAMGWSRQVPDDTQMRHLQIEIRRGMEQGATGVSTGLDYINQCFASTAEIAEACSAAAEFNGVYVTHIRYKKGLLAALRDAVDIGKRSGLAVHISHLKAVNTADLEAILDYIDRVAVHEVEFTFDVYPYMPGSTMLSYFLPLEVWEDGPLAAMGKLNRPDIRRRFATFLASDQAPNFNKVFFAWMPSANHETWKGRTVAEYLELSGREPADALCDLLIDENLRVLMVAHLDDDHFIEPFLKHDCFMLGSDGIWQPGGVVHPRQYGSAPRILGLMARDKQLFSLEAAIRKMTSFPAWRFGLKDRGELAPGTFADIAVFDPATIGDRATYQQPQQLSTGMQHVLVNGRFVIRDGAAIDDFGGDWPGRALRYRQS
jgi:N-acyl-D-amino-acid deacylase